MARWFMWLIALGSIGCGGRAVTADPRPRADARPADARRVDALPGDATVDQAGRNDAAVRLVHVWSKRLGGTLSDSSTAVRLDGSGNVYLTGGFKSRTVDFGGGPLTSAGDFDMFVASYTAAGAHRFSKRFGGATFDRALGLAVDATGNSYVCGVFRDTATFGGAPLTSAGDLDVFLASYTARGEHRFSKRFGSRSRDWCTSLAADGRGSVVITGYFQHTADFGGASLQSAGAYDVFLARYATSDGAHQFSRRLGGSSGDEGMAVAMDDSGNVFLTGVFSGTASFGGATLSSATGSSGYVAGYTASGAHRFSDQLSAALGWGVALDRSVGLYVTGGLKVGLFGGGHGGVFVARYSASGESRFFRRFAGEAFGSAAAVDSSGNVYVTGRFKGTIDLGGGPLTSAGDTDLFVASYTASGVHRFSKRFGGTSLDQGWALVVDSSDSVYLAGTFNDTVDFGGGPLTSAGASDVFLLKLTPK